MIKIPVVNQLYVSDLNKISSSTIFKSNYEFSAPFNVKFRYSSTQFEGDRTEPIIFGRYPINPIRFQVLRQ